MRRSFSVFAVLLAGSAGLAGLAPPAAVAAVTATTVTLPTGDRVGVRTTADGRPLYDILPAAGKGMARALVHLRLGERDYELPGTALPYLGRGLDLSLFDVSALLAGAPLPARPGDVRDRAWRSSSRKTTRAGTSAGQGLFAGGARSRSPGHRRGGPFSPAR